MIIGVISEPEGITDAEVEAYIEDHKDVYKDGMFEEGIEDYPVPFVDFPVRNIRRTGYNSNPMPRLNPAAAVLINPGSRCVPFGWKIMTKK